MLLCKSITLLGEEHHENKAYRAAACRGARADARRLRRKGYCGHAAARQAAGACRRPIAGKPLKRSFVDFLSNLSPYDKLIGGTLIFIVLLSLMALAHSMKGGSGSNMTFVWIAAIVIFGIAEAATAGLVSIWFVAGAVAALLALELGAVLWLQIVVFLAVSIAALIATRPLAHKMLDKTIVPTNADRVLHHTAKVTETIDNENTTGAVYIDGKTWTARSEDGDVIARGSMVTIVRMEGVKLFVRKEREEP